MNNDVYKEIGKIKNYGSNYSSQGYINIVDRIDFFCNDKSLSGPSWDHFKKQLSGIKEVTEMFKNTTEIMHNLIQEAGVRISNCVSTYKGNIPIPSMIDYGTEFAKINYEISDLEAEKRRLQHELATVKSNSLVSSVSNNVISTSKINTRISEIDKEITDYHQYERLIGNLQLIYNEYSEKLNNVKLMFKSLGEEFNTYI